MWPLSKVLTDALYELPTATNLAIARAAQESLLQAWQQGSARYRIAAPAYQRVVSFPDRYMYRQQDMADYIYTLASSQLTYATTRANTVELTDFEMSVHNECRFLSARTQEVVDVVLGRF